MLFLPIDKDSLLPDSSNANSSFNKSNVSKNRSQSRGSLNLSNFGQVKASIRRQNLHERTSPFQIQKQSCLALNTTATTSNKKQSTTTRQEHKRQQQHAFNAQEKIKKTTQDANDLIEYMRILNTTKQQQQQTQLQSNSQITTPSEINGVFSAYNQQTKNSPSRIMTSMSPSTKQKLRRDLQTFSRQYITLDEQNPLLPRAPKSIMKLPLPQYTKHAYYRANEPEMQAIRQKTTFSRNSRKQISFSRSFEKIELENIRKEFNDEIILFSSNASKPLVSQDRHYGKVHNQKPQQNNIRTNLPYASSYISRDNNSMARKRSTTPVRKEQRNNSFATQCKRYTSTRNSNNLESVKKMNMKNKMNLLSGEDYLQPKAQTFYNNFNAKKNSMSKNQDNSKMYSRQAYTTQQNMAKIKDIAADLLVKRPNSLRNNQQSFKTEPTNNCPKSPYGHMEESEKDPENVQESHFTVKLCMNCQRSVKFRQPQAEVVVQKARNSLQQNQKQQNFTQQNHIGSSQKIMINSVAAVTKKRIQTAKAILGRTKDQLSSSAEQLVYVIKSNSNNNPAATQLSNTDQDGGAPSVDHLQQPSGGGNMIKVGSGTNTNTTAGGGVNEGVSRNSLTRQMKTQESTGMDMYTQSDAVIVNQNQRNKWNYSGYVCEEDQKQKLTQIHNRRKSSSQQRQNDQPKNFRRPKSSFTNAPKDAIHQQSKQKQVGGINSGTFNLMNSKAQEARELNGRSFIIYGKEEYESYKDNQNHLESKN